MQLCWCVLSGPDHGTPSLSLMHAYHNAANACWGCTQRRVQGVYTHTHTVYMLYLGQVVSTYNEVQDFVPDGLIIKEAHLGGLIPPVPVPYDGTRLRTSLY